MDAISLDLDSINRSEIARVTDSHVTHISRIFNPALPNMPSLGLARKISSFLGCSVEDLCRFLEDKLGKPSGPLSEDT